MKRLKLIASTWKQEWYIRYGVYYLLAYSVLPGKPKSDREWTRYQPHRSSVDWLRLGTLGRSVVDVFFTLLVLLFIWKCWESRKPQARQNSLPDVLALSLTILFMLGSLGMYFRPLP